MYPMVTMYVQKINNRVKLQLVISHDLSIMMLYVNTPIHHVS